MNYKKEILLALSLIKRRGMSDLMDFLNESTFFTDPASCNEHNAYEGGLCEHSYRVYSFLNDRYGLEFDEISDSLRIIGLLHDISLAGSFQKSFRNVPLKGKDGKNKKDERGKIIFMEKEVYEPFETSLPYPHSILSTIILKRYIPLTKLEDLAITWHSDTISFDKKMMERAQMSHKLIFYTYFANREAKLYYRTRD